MIEKYNRQAAIVYAKQWAFSRNPKYYAFDKIGGDCTNFASQCIFAGCGIMNFTPTYGWYYINANQKAPAWTGVEYLWNFLTRKVFSVGPAGEPCALEELLPGDLIQLSFKGEGFQHSPVVVAVGSPVSTENILVAAHSYDADNRPLATYEYQQARFLHITGTVWP